MGLIVEYWSVLLIAAQAAETLAELEAEEYLFFRSLCHHKWYTDFIKVSFKRRKQNCKYNRILISLKNNLMHRRPGRKYINRLTVVSLRVLFFFPEFCVSTIIMYYSYFEKLNISCFNSSLFPTIAYMAHLETYTGHQYLFHEPFPLCNKLQC